MPSVRIYKRNIRRRHTSKRPSSGIKCRRPRPRSKKRSSRKRRSLPVAHHAKTTYRRWEASIRKNSRKLLPTAGNPVVAFRKKVVLVVDFYAADGRTLSEHVLAASTAVNRKRLPAKHQRSLFHIGNRRAGNVSAGLSDDQNTFKHPATDFGGLTNVQQKPGQRLVFVGDPVKIDNHDTTDTRMKVVAQKLYDQWLATSNKTSFYRDSQLRRDVQKFVASVVHDLSAAGSDYRAAALRCYSHPRQLRALYTADDVRRKHGKYYVRTFSGNDREFAREPPNLKELYMSIARDDATEDSFVTPNLNIANLRNEYVPVF